MIRLIGIDVDGTLLDSHGELPDDNVSAIHEAVSAGIHVALVTGRSYPFARPAADLLPNSISLIVSNGAVERGMDGSTFARRLSACMRAAYPRSKKGMSVVSAWSIAKPCSQRST